MPEAMAKRCEWCGDEFKPQKAIARFCCSPHRTAWHKEAKKHQASAPPGLIALQSGVAAPRTRRPASPAPEAPETPESKEPGPIEAATVAELTKYGRIDTADGAKAVKLARRIDMSDLADTGSNMAALSKAHDQAMDRALHGVAAEAEASDPVHNLDEAMAAIITAAVPEAVAS